MAAATLALEAFVVFFAMLAALRLTDLSAATVWGGGGVLALACVGAAGVVRRPGGMALGWALQVVLLATGLVVPAMFGLGAVFLAMWVWLLWIGRRIDLDRAGWAGPEPAESTPEVGPRPDGAASDGPV